MYKRAYVCTYVRTYYLVTVCSLLRKYVSDALILKHLHVVSYQNSRVNKDLCTYCIIRT